MTLTPNPITATLPAGVAMLRPWAAWHLMLSHTQPQITTLQRPQSPITPTTLAAAVDGATLLSLQEIYKVIGPMQQALIAFRQGQASYLQWVRLCGAYNVGSAIERFGIVRGLAAEFERAFEVLEAIGARAGTTQDAWKPVTLYPQEISVLADLVRLHKFQMQQLSFSEYTQAHTHAVSKVKSLGGEVHGGNP